MEGTMRGITTIGAAALAIACGITVGACRAAGGNMAGELQTVPSVDLNRYLGMWYEIARYPNRFQRSCHKSTATYSLRDDGDIRVVNACRRNGPDGEEKSVEGKAWVVDKATNAKLRVRFFWPFWGSYWIIDLGKDYEYAVVGHPDRNYLWILSRTPIMDDKVFEGIADRLKQNGYDPEKLIRQ
jgi:apolipoprotein D and lipocalin family protein